MWHYLMDVNKTIQINTAFGMSYTQTIICFFQLCNKIIKRKTIEGKEYEKKTELAYISSKFRTIIQDHCLLVLQNVCLYIISGKNVKVRKLTQQKITNNSVKKQPQL